MTGDEFTPYQIGLTRLLEKLGEEHRRYIEALTLQSRLLNNIAKAREYGDALQLQHDRAQIVRRSGHERALREVGRLRLAGAPDAVSVATLCANPAFDHLSTAGDLAQEGVPFPLLPLVACADATLFADDDAGVAFLCQCDLYV